MRRAVEAGRRRFPGIDANEGLPGGETLETGMRRLRRRMAAAFRPGQDQIDKVRVFLDRIVEQREAAVAMTEKPQHRRHRLDRLLQRRRYVERGGAQYRANVDQVAQHLELDRRGARRGAPRPAARRAAT